VDAVADRVAARGASKETDAVDDRVYNQARNLRMTEHARPTLSPTSASA